MSGLDENPRIHASRLSRVAFILFTKAFSGKHIKETCLSNVKFSFKYVVNFRFVLKLFSKLRKLQTLCSGGVLSVNGLW